MTEPEDMGARLAEVERRVDTAVADLGVRVDANRRAINALGVQSAARFDRLESRFDTLESRFDTLESRVGTLESQVATGFAAMRAGFDQTAAGFDRIATLLAERDDR